MRTNAVGLALWRCLCLLPFALGACSRNEPVPAKSPASNQAVYQAKGIVRGFAPDKRAIRIEHEEIPGYMAAMTMDFKVRDRADLSALSLGDKVSFRLTVSPETHWVDEIRVIARGAGNDGRETPLASPPELAELKIGDTFPDAEFLSESGKRIRPSDFHGMPRAVTFFFSRCPLPDFCPRMQRNFSQTREILAGQSGQLPNWQFLSVSFDPEFDKPAVLAQYALAYRGPDTNHWLFAAAPEPVLLALAPRLDLIVHRDPNGGLSHNLRTVVVDSRGQIFRQFDGNDWTPGQLADALMEAARSAKQP